MTLSFCTVHYTQCIVHCDCLILNSTLYTHQQGLDEICNHTAELFFNDIFQLIIIMIVTLAKHKYHFPDDGCSDQNM
jgi:hypothetical protein